MGKCSIANCEDQTRIIMGWCSKHYQRWKKYGDPEAKVRKAGRKPIDHPDGTRTCNRCGERKKLDLYSLDKSATLGRRATCSACRSVHMADYYERNSERIKTRMANYRDANPEIVRESERSRYRKHREKRIELACESVHVRRSRMYSSDFDQGITQKTLRKRDGDLCHYCQRRLDFNRAKHGEVTGLRANIDHVIPLARGGSHTWENVVLACRDCNFSKGARLVEEWVSRPSFLGSGR